MMNNEIMPMAAIETKQTVDQQTVLETVQQADEKPVIEHLERYPGVRRELTQEQLDAREEHRQELERTFSYDDYKAVRKEMHSGLRDPSVLIRGNSVTFNQAVLDSLEGVSYVNVYFSEKLGKMAIKPVSGNTPHSMHWCVDGKDNKRKPRRVICPEMTKWFFEAMGWEQNIRYRVLGYLIEVEGEQVYVFDFNYARMFNERRKDEEGKLLPVDRKGHFSEEARHSMAMPVEEFNRSIAMEEANGLVNAAMLIGADKLDAVQIEETAQEAPVAATEAQDAEAPAAIAPKAEEAQEAPTEANTSDRESDGSLLPVQTGMVASPADNRALIL